SCAKHFPGHGDTDVDSHLALPVVGHDRARLEHVELVPFRGLAAEVPVVMVAHVACPAVGDGELPATLSWRIATSLLRHDVGFTGVAVTDAMDMQGVAGQFGDDEAAVRAVLAGCDLLLYCFEIEKPLRARAGLRAALASGRLTASRIEEAASRVRALQRRAAAAAPNESELPPPTRDAELYRTICRRALRVPDPAGWRAFGLAVREAQRLVVTGSPGGGVMRLAARLGASGITVETRALEGAPAAEKNAPNLVVLGERRPLPLERVALLRRLAHDVTPIALANVLTPETDSPLAESYTTILRSADHTDGMLDVIASYVLDADPDLT